MRHTNWQLAYIDCNDYSTLSFNPFFILNNVTSNDRVK